MLFSFPTDVSLPWGSDALSEGRMGIASCLLKKQ